MSVGPLVLSAILSLFVGAIMGLFGGGGSVLSVPMLLYVTRLEAHAAIAVSLFMVSTASGVGAMVHARADGLRLRPALAFAIPSAVLAFVGGLLARFFAPSLLLALFAFLMLGTAVRMLKHEPATTAIAIQPAPGRLVVAGGLTGFVSGLIGAGGGFLVVPALVFFAGLGMYEAIGTSLLVISLSSAAGFLGHVVDVSLDPAVLAAVSIPALAGVVAGSAVARRVPSRALRKGFGGLILVLALFLLVEQLA